MKVCSFFGHRDVSGIESLIYDTIIGLIEKDNISVFYVGSNGNFDAMAKSAVLKAKKIYPNIKLFLILAYMPTEKTKISHDFDASLYPENLELAPKRFAISYRNKWIVNQSDTIVFYVKNSFGGACSAKKQAEKLNKNIINLV
ncbi:MAG: hypothetical protein R3Y33_06650 [Clostridia bacterium]